MDPSRVGEVLLFQNGSKPSWGRCCGNKFQLPLWKYCDCGSVVIADHQRTETAFSGSRPTPRKGRSMENI
ncbi:hypothetical protein CEXT_381201 [Caerostris extrusa]|uniref:Uncharacterized protein n=1 Tax=Caerostris extrusa TaxID=172846 RepID=A0AAV4WQV3_CAEEX|nr:hypothetical protein CEXT_381201 [Caerostris extrusa]